MNKKKVRLTLREYCNQHPNRKHLLSEWDYKKNGDLSPDTITYGSTIKITWKLPYDVPMDYPVKHLRGKHFNFTWDATPNNRCRDDGPDCPYLTGNAVWKGFNDLGTINPKLAREWHPTKNKGLTPIQISANSNRNIWWYLPYDVPMDYPIAHLRGRHFVFEWKAAVSSRNRYGNGCSFLVGKAVWRGFNDFATTHPKIALEWHPTKNDKLTPEMITYGSTKLIWWHLPYDVPMDYPIKHLRGKHFDFEWRERPNTRTSMHTGCPYLSGSEVWTGFNDLITTHSELAAEWHASKNGNLTPDKISYGSTNKIWWQCKQGHEWLASPNDRTNSKTGCPFCNESKGEKEIKRVLDKNKIIYIPEYRFKDRGKLRDDFALFDIQGNVVATIEYHGIQHYQPVDFAGKGDNWTKKEFEKNQDRDKIKFNYLKIHRIPQLIIPYWEFDNIETLVLEFLKTTHNSKDAAA